MDYQAGLRARDRLFTEVGFFFNNTRRGVGTCEVCTSPALGAICRQCRTSREAFGTRLADLVVPLTYIKGKKRPRHQSEHHMYAYKAAQPAPKCRRDLLLMVFAATALHGRCIARSMGSHWDAVTFVPSTTRPGRDHPVAQLAAQVMSRRQKVRRPVVRPGPGASMIDRAPRADGFIVSSDRPGNVKGCHVLVVEDTWVTGAKAQSVAVALKDAGASIVTVLAVGRWLRYDWHDHKTFIEQLHQPYDALICPVTGGPCPD